MKKLLIIAPYQFGELSDCYYWSKYATYRGVDTTYIGYKYKSRFINERHLPGLKVKRVPHFNNKYILGLIFYLRCIFEIVLHKHQNILICRMPYCQIIAKLFKNRNVILDVRTLSVSTNPTVRDIEDKKLKQIKPLFKKCTVISEGVGEKIGKPYNILPLGAEAISISKKTFDSMRMFYIGTFNNRQLSIFIEGLSKFQHKFDVSCSFDIVGGGSESEENALIEAVKKYGAKGVKFRGYLNHDEAIEYFDKCNVGICYVPITEYYQYQPPTKLYEYLLSGMACLATGTISNMQVITNDNGVIVSDSADSIAEGLYRLYCNLSNFSSDSIANSASNYHWQKIVDINLLNLIEY